MSQRLYNVMNRSPIIFKKLHGRKDKIEASKIYLIRFCKYWLHMQSEIAMRNRVVWRQSFSFEEHSEQLEDKFFRRLYRITKRQMKELCSLISEKCTRKQPRPNTITVETMVCITMRILAGASYLDVSWPYGVSVPSVYKIFHEVLIALDGALKNINFPRSEEECQKESARFACKRRSPILGVIAALDGIAIKIQKPSQREVSDPRKYRNRKNFFAVLVQAAVSADYRFTFVSATHAGGTHDSTAFQASSLHTMIVNKQLPRWAVVVADDAYQNNLNVVTPYSGRNLSRQKDSFNFYHSSCRMTVEQVFGMLVSRFGIFWGQIRMNLETATMIIGVTCKLHNFIIDNTDVDEFDYLPVHEENNVEGVPDVFLQNTLYAEMNVTRGRRNRCTDNRRDEISQELSGGGYLRPQ